MKNLTLAVEYTHIHKWAVYVESGLSPFKTKSLVNDNNTPT